MARIVTMIGTRPEIIKMASVIHELRARRADSVVVHTGQPDDENLSEVFFEGLDFPKPDWNLEVGSGTQAEQTATALVRLEAAFRELSPDIVLVEGDTNTVHAAHSRLTTGLAPFFAAAGILPRPFRAQRDSPSPGTAGAV